MSTFVDKMRAEIAVVAYNQGHADGRAAREAQPDRYLGNTRLQYIRGWNVGRQVGIALDGMDRYDLPLTADGSLVEYKTVRR